MGSGLPSLVEINDLLGGFRTNELREQPKVLPKAAHAALEGGDFPRRPVFKNVIDPQRVSKHIQSGGNGSWSEIIGIVESSCLA